MFSKCLLKYFFFQQSKHIFTNPKPTTSTQDNLHIKNLFSYNKIFYYLETGQPLLDLCLKNIYFTLKSLIQNPSLTASSGFNLFF